MQDQRRPGGHFDRFNFYNAAPDLDVLDVQFTLHGVPGTAGSFASVPGLECAEQAYCDQVQEITGFHCAATVRNSQTAEEWQVTWDYNDPQGPHLKQIAVGIVQACPDQAGGPVYPEPLGVVYIKPDEGEPVYIPVTQMTVTG